MNPKLLHRVIIGIFVSLYLITSTISTIHSIDFFQISNSYLMSVFLAIAFEVGAAGSLASIIVRDKMNMFLVWSIFIVLTLFQIMNNVYFSFMHLGDFSKWSELFGLNEEDVILQKRIVSIVLGAVLPLIALGFIKALVDYINPAKGNKEESTPLERPFENAIKTITDEKSSNSGESGEELKEVKQVVEELKEVKPTEVKQVEEPEKLEKIKEVKEEHKAPEILTSEEVEKNNQMDSILNDDLGNSLNSIRRGGM